MLWSGSVYLGTSLPVHLRGSSGQVVPGAGGRFGFGSSVPGQDSSAQVNSLDLAHISWLDTWYRDSFSQTWKDNQYHCAHALWCHNSRSKFQTFKVYKFFAIDMILIQPEPLTLLLHYLRTQTFKYSTTLRHIQTQLVSAFHKLDPIKFLSLKRYCQQVLNETMRTAKLTPVAARLQEVEGKVDQHVIPKEVSVFQLSMTLGLFISPWLSVTLLQPDSFPWVHRKH